MLSYLSVGSVSTNYIRAEVELIDFIDSKPEDFATKPCEMVDVRRELFEEAGYFPQEGEIYICEQENGEVKGIVWEDPEERERRAAL